MKTSKLTLPFVVMILLMVALAGCRESSEEDMEVPISGKMVYVEDFSGRHGVLAGRFGDLVLIDGNENKRYALTDDHYYYAYPNLVNNGKEVWFEAKRGDDLWPAGLGSRSDIYSLHVETREIKNIRDSLSTMFGIDIEEGTSKLSVSPSESKMVFKMKDRNNPNESSSTSFYYVDKDKLEIIRVENELTRDPIDHTFWSPDETKIVYEMMVRYGLVYTYNLEDQERRTVTNEFIESENRIFCRSGSWQNSNEFVYMCRHNVGNRSKIYKYNYEEAKSTEIAEIVKDNFLIRSLHISRDGSFLVFIGRTMEDFNILKSAIYVYDLETEEMHAFAVNKKEKRWLRWYEDL